MASFTKDEKKLISHAKVAIVKYNTHRKATGGIDTLYAFVLSGSGKIYDGGCFESNIAQANICGERLAIANMVLQESYKSKAKIVLVADPVPDVQEKSTMPCGTCRHLIREFGGDDTIVICMQYMQKKKGWVFLKIEKHTIKELYPWPYVPVRWDTGKI